MLMLKVCIVCFHQFHFINVTSEVKSYHSGLSLHFYLGWPVTWVDVRGGCIEWYQSMVHSSD